MRQVILGLVGGISATGAVLAEGYSFTFTAVVHKMWSFQTTVFCVEPIKKEGRVPRGCILSERAIAYPNHLSARFGGVACAAGHPIAFHPNGTLAFCKLESEQGWETASPSGYGMCYGYVTFYEDGLADCD